MTRDNAIALCMLSGRRLVDRLRNDRPQWLCDRLEEEAAEDTVDVLIALGILKVDDEPLSAVGEAKEP